MTLRRRDIARPRRCVALAVFAVAATLGPTGFTGQPAARSAHHLTVVTDHVRKSGRYTVIVSLAAAPVLETVDVSIGNQTMQGVPVGPNAGQALAFFVHLRSRRLVVRVLASGRAVGTNVAFASAAAATTPTVGGAYTQLAFSDDFDGAAGTPPNPADWSYANNGSCGAGTLSADTKSLSNASLDGDGGLAIRALLNPGGEGGSQFTSASITTAGHFSFTYGTIEARIAMPAGSGLCDAFWLQQTNPSGGPCPIAPCPEIDVMEHISPFPNVGWADLHGPMQGSSVFQQWQSQVLSARALTGTFQTWGVTRSVDKITWTLDGVPYATATPSSLAPTAEWLFNGTPMSIVFDLAVGGAWALTPTSNTGFPATMDVQWVRVYE